MRPTLESIQCIKLQKTLWQDNLWFRTMLSNLSMHQNLMEGLLKQNSGPQPQSFCFSRSGVSPENLHFSQLPTGCWCCRSRVHMWRISNIEEIVKRQTHHPQVTISTLKTAQYLHSLFPSFQNWLIPLHTLVPCNTQRLFHRWSLIQSQEEVLRSCSLSVRIPQLQHYWHLSQIILCLRVLSHALENI